MTTSSSAAITRNFIRAKRPCADGYRWLLRRPEADSNYQTLLDDLVRDGRVNDACWLLDQFGPTDDVLQVNHLLADALVFAGTVECTGNADVTSLLRTGRSLSVRGGLQVGGSLQVGDDLAVGAALRCDADIRIGGDARTEWGVDAGKELVCDGHLRVGWGVRCGAGVRVKGDLTVAQDLSAQGKLHCDGRVRVGGDLVVVWAIGVERGIEVVGALDCTDHLEAGWGIRAGGAIRSHGAIRVGESLFAGSTIEAGSDYGVFAGLVVPVQAWQASACVTASERPQRLFSGHWSPS